MKIIGIIKKNIGTDRIRVREIATGKEYNADRMSVEKMIGKTEDGTMICEFEVKERTSNDKKRDNEN